MKVWASVLCVVLVLASLWVLVPALSLSELRAHTSVLTVTVAGDSSYNNLRSGYNADINRLPAVIVSPINETGVQLALEYAVTNGLPVSVRAGGHSAPLLGVLDEAVVVDLSTYMKSVTFDAVLKTATVQPGARWRDFYSAMVPLGWATPGGNCPSVGVGGLTLGGGANELASKWGYALDNVLSMRVVLANGSIVMVSNVENPDLFWGLLGGGHGGLGVVTVITFQLHPIEPLIYSVWITYDWADFDTVIGFVARYMEQAADEVNIYATGWKSGSVLNLGVSCTYIGPASVGAQACSIFSDPNIVGATPQSAFGSAKPFDEIVRGGTDPKGKRSFTKGCFIKDLNRRAIKRIREAVEDGPDSSHGYNTARVNFYWQGGAMLDRLRNATAYVHRSYSWSIVWLASFIPDSMSQAYSDWIGKSYRRMTPFNSGESYNNYPDLDLADWEAAYYAENYPRLQLIKAAYDPSNLFRGPQTIRLP